MAPYLATAGFLAIIHIIVPCSAVYPHDGAIYEGDSSFGSWHHTSSSVFSGVPRGGEGTEGRTTLVPADDALRSFASARAMKTGTTIAGVVFEGGIILGADTRATGGKTVCDRNCDKIHILAANMACCGAGTSADAVKVTEGVRLALLRMTEEMQACLPSPGQPYSPPPPPPSSSSQLPPDGTEEEENSTDIRTTPKVSKVRRDSRQAAIQRQHLRVTAAALLLKRHLFRHQGTVSAALVLGGVDALGEHLFQIHEGGSLAEVDFTAMGSGSLAALSVLERGHREGLGEDAAKGLVLSAIAAGIENDLGSGSNIDLCIITSERGLEHHRGAWKCAKPVNSDATNAPPGIRSDALVSSGDGEEEHRLEEKEEEGKGHTRRRSTPIGASRSPEEKNKPSPSSWEEATSTQPSKGKPKLRELTEESSSKGTGSAPGSHIDGVEGSDGSCVEVGGEGGSRAWVGSVKRRSRGKSVVRVEEGGGELRSIRCSALDDKIELL